ncbi:Clp protease N-terminal domain-containing protein [Streptomyces sp. ISL-12]|uniref:Clp protease N-terminal domain-containing protein n=1 Tax=Streptomyces sp. ISL-12 TaxID=2819177 RepID=UPI001BE50156|nr:Clp protease N-terminal domain-containing protein [Streptomyces sp. ISL-12]MBT2415272.1 Clp protease N-terminal domain-containing protein [Streptomyces sp. ISL-12]
MDQRTSDRRADVTTEFERDVVKLLLETMRAVAKQERTDVGTEGLLYALVSGEWAAGSAIAPGMKASGTLGGSIAARGTSVWISGDAGDGEVGSPDDEREIDAFWREVRHEEAKRLRWKNRKEEEPQNIGLPPMTPALRTCLRKALEAAREEGTVSVRVRHVARALVELPDTRAREAMVVEKLDVSAASTALHALRGSDEVPEPGPVVLMRKAGTFGKSGNPLTRKFISWVSGGGAGFGSAVVSAVRSEAHRSAVRRGAPETEPVDALLGILALDRSLTVAERALPEELAGANQGAELLRRHGARQGAVARVLLPSTGVAQEVPPEVEGSADFERRLLHVTQFTASAQGSPTVGTTHLLAALLDETGTDPESAAEVARVLAESGVDVDGLRAEPELRVPGGAAQGA